ncbi:hypothetical protein [Robertkochia solimangrovi]|uniref:hypothetical protein n=1 Tax=Robertkochia solimangrovi TaxID=2213046 RepID=UPI00117E833D|nr:hypothetical protein [Robertkochia solimangrovi]TRZ44456.1 hypothetical protein DMZ48_08110 [Robertkochia solimangrovi]
MEIKSRFFDEPFGISHRRYKILISIVMSILVLAFYAASFAEVRMAHEAPYGFFERILNGFVHMDYQYMAIGVILIAITVALSTRITDRVLGSRPVVVGFGVDAAKGVIEIATRKPTSTTLIEKTYSADEIVIGLGNLKYGITGYVHECLIIKYEGITVGVLFTEHDMWDSVESELFRKAVYRLKQMPVAAALALP